MTFDSKGVCAIVLVALFATTASHATDDEGDAIKSVVDRSVQPVMMQYGIPGMAVGVVVAGRTYVFNYGVASRATRKPVTSETLFEIGSISKTLTATLTSYAQADGYLSLSDPTSKYLPSLRESQFGSVSLLNLGTHTPGGLPLQVPANIRNNDQLMRYLGHWQPTYAPGSYRTYANAGIGTLGLITAKSMGQDFTVLMEGRLLPALGMSSSYINVPKTRMSDYAQGYTGEGEPIRVAPGVLSSEAYGIKSTASDLVRFMQANMNLVQLDEKLQRAITDTHTGYYTVGAMTQDLIWEQYPYPASLKTLLGGNSSDMILNANPAQEIRPPQSPREDVWINKTGSTNGFGAYVAFVPQKQLGIVILGNMSYPIDERVTAAYRILSSLAEAEH